MSVFSLLQPIITNKVEQQRLLVEQLKREAQVTRISVSQVLNTFFIDSPLIIHILHTYVMHIKRLHRNASYAYN